MNVICFAFSLLFIFSICAMDKPSLEQEIKLVSQCIKAERELIQRSAEARDDSRFGSIEVIDYENQRKQAQERLAIQEKKLAQLLLQRRKLNKS